MKTRVLELREIQILGALPFHQINSIRIFVYIIFRYFVRFTHIHNHIKHIPVCLDELDGVLGS